jgi:hypothetical protein
MCWGCWDRRRLAAALQQQQVSVWRIGFAGFILRTIMVDVLGMLGREQAGGSTAAAAGEMRRVG